MVKDIMNTEEFINKAKNIYGNKYDYSKTKYIDSKTKVCIICPEHGEFWQQPNSHFVRGCNKCSKPIFDKESFIKKAKEVHGDKYNYSKVEYNKSSEKVCIICPEHGEFWQTPNAHCNGKHKHGCPQCGFINAQKENKKRIEQAANSFIEKAKEIHKDKYDYSKVEYKDIKTKVCIICPIHGEFWQTPDKHTNSGHGCLKCKESNLEKEVREFLEEANINYEQEFSAKWLGKQRIDFYLPDYNIAIECQGEQHYKPVDFANKGEEWARKLFLQNLKNDYSKKKKIIEHNINLLYYTKPELKETNEFTNKEEFLTFIKI